MSDFDDWMKGQAKPKVETNTTSSPAGGFDAWMKGEDRPKVPSTVLPQDRQTFGRRPTTLDESLTQSARFNRGRALPLESPDSKSGTLYESRMQRNRQEQFSRKPVLERASERTYDAFARGGAYLSRAARQATEAGARAVKGIATGDFTPVDIAPWREFEEERNRELEERRASRPTSLATEVGEGIIEAAPVAAAGGLLSAAGGGGLLASTLTGGGIAAAGADWNDPKRAILQTGIGALSPVGGKIGGRVIGAAADKLSRPTLQMATRVLGEAGSGAVTNVAGTAAEQLAFEGKLDPRKLAVSAGVGAGTSAPGALGAARRPVKLAGPIEALSPRTPEGAIIAGPSSLPSRKLLPPARGEEIIPTEPLSRAVREVISKPDPRFIPKIPQPDAPATQVISQPDAPATQRLPRPLIPEVNQRLIDRTRTRVDEMIQDGRFSDAIAGLKAHQQALRDAKAQAKSAPGLRVQLEQQIAQAGNRIGEVRAMAQKRKAQENATTAELPAVRRSTDAPLLETVNNPEGGVPPRTERPSGRFGASVRQQEARAEAAPQPRRKATETLSPVEYLKRKTAGDGIRFSDRGEAALLGAKEAGIVGLTNRNSKWTLSDAQVMLEEGGFRLEDGRQFTDPSVTESDVLDFLGATGKRGRLGTRGIDQTLADEEAAYYAKLEEEQAAPPPKRTPPPPAAPRRPGQRVGAPQPRRISETGALEDVGDFFGQMKAEERPKLIEQTPPRPSTERLPVPKADDENIATLRARQEELGRLAYDRRGEFPSDLRDEYNQINAAIREYQNARTPVQLAPPPESGPPEKPMSNTEKFARREALQYRTPRFPETSTPGRPVTQEMQVPKGMKPSESFSSREDARQGYFDRFDDQELIVEIQRMEDIKNSAIGGRSKLSPEAIEANNFDLKIAKQTQTDRRAIQKAQGRDEATIIPARTPSRPARKIQHTEFGEVVESGDQKGVPRGKLRVIGKDSAQHIIQNPRAKRGNRIASFIKAEPSIPAEALPELRSPNAPQPPKVPARTPSKINYTIPDEAMPELRGRQPRATILGAGLGPLQQFFESKGKSSPQPSLFGEEKPRSLSRKEIAETAGGVQAVAQLGNPRFVIRNVLQHVAFGKQERAATRIAAALDWAYSKASGKPRQVTAPRGSDLRAYVQNWGKAVQAYKSGKPLPGKPNADYLTADANKLDKAVGKLMTWMNEIPDAANWQTRFEESLQSIMGSKKLKAPLDMDAIVEQATMEANRASLRDENFASVALSKLKKGLNTLSSPIFGTDKFGAGDFILKYAQTPGALLKRGIERSPLGLFQVAKEAATPGPFRRRNTLLALSRVAEGAATGVGLGAALAAAGVLVGPEAESKSGKAMEREEGVKGYSLNGSALLRFMTGDFAGDLRDGDSLYSIDWLQPWAMNLSAGAALWNLHKDGKMGAGEGAKTTGEAIYNSLAKTLDVMGDQSVLKNLSRYLDKGIGETFSDKFLNFAKAVGLDVPGSFVPSLARQARQVLDPFERDTRAEQRGGFKAFIEEAGNRALAQLPGVSETFPKRPSLLTGEDRKTGLGELSPPARTLAQLSPANISTYTPRPVAQEINRLNRAGERVAITFPAPSTDKRTGQRESTSSLRGRERRFAESFSKLSQEMINDPLYKDSDNATKAAAFEGLKRYLRELGKEDFEEKGIDEIIESAINTVEKRKEDE